MPTRTFCILFLLPFIAACAAETTPSAQPSAPAPVKKKLRYLALGDSYTIGQSVAREDSFPAQLAKLLSKDGVEFEDPQIIAKTGWRTDDLSAAIDRADPKGPFDLVTLLIGVNNQFQGKEEEDYKKEFSELLARAIKFAGDDASRVIVLSIPDYGVTPFGQRMDPEKIARELERYNKTNKEATEKAGAKYVDIMPESREASQDRELIASDRLHPSKKMYAAWAKLAVEEWERPKKDAKDK
jgi:lysophospholipase L1-like esterase